MANIKALVGLDKALAQVEKKHFQNLRAGLLEAGLYLLRVSQRLVPVEHGQLKQSGKVMPPVTDSNGNILVIVGYTAKYALWVHECVGMVLAAKNRPDGKKVARSGQGHAGYYWDPQGRAQAKFLEAPARENREDLVRIVRARAMGTTENWSEHEA